MSVLDIETLGFGVSKETFDPPSFGTYMPKYTKI